MPPSSGTLCYAESAIVKRVASTAECARPSIHLLGRYLGQALAGFQPQAAICSPQSGLVHCRRRAKGLWLYVVLPYLITVQSTCKVRADSKVDGWRLLRRYFIAIASLPPASARVASLLPPRDPTLSLSSASPPSRGRRSATAGLLARGDFDNTPS